MLVGIKKDDSDYDSAFDSDDSSSEDTRPQKSTKGIRPINIITRKRSNSIPSTPSIAQIKVGSVSII